MDDATQFQFVVAPNTEINQIRFENKEFVLGYNCHPFATSCSDFEDAGEEGADPVYPVALIGRQTNPLTSCFKMYRFLSNANVKK